MCDEEVRRVGDQVDVLPESAHLVPRPKDTEYVVQSVPVGVPAVVG